MGKVFYSYAIAIFNKYSVNDVVGASQGWLSSKRCCRSPTFVSDPLLRMVATVIGFTHSRRSLAVMCSSYHERFYYFLLLHRSRCHQFSFKVIKRILVAVKFAFEHSGTGSPLGAPKYPPVATSSPLSARLLQEFRRLCRVVVLAHRPRKTQIRCEESLGLHSLSPCCYCGPYPHIPNLARTFPLLYPKVRCWPHLLLGIHVDYDDGL